MSIEKRRYIRFSLDIPALRRTGNDEKEEITIKQISVGGCLLDWDDSIFTGDELRLEFTLPNNNHLPVMAKAIYRFNGQGIGVKFNDITAFEQELLAGIITERLETEGLPVMVDPFTQPPKYFEESTKYDHVPPEKLQAEEALDEALATEG
jgi:hypothetical protein